VIPPTDPFAQIRPATDADGPALRGLIELDVGAMPYAAIPTYFLGLAFEGRSTESRAVVAERGGEILGFALFGEIAGAIGAGRLHFISVTAAARLRAIGARLCEAAVADLRSHGARLVIAEVPAHPALASGLALLARSGFAETARVADYYKDGIDLVLLQRTIPLPNP